MSCVKFILDSSGRSINTLLLQEHYLHTYVHNTYIHTIINLSKTDYNIGASKVVNIHAHIRMQKLTSQCLDNYDILHVQLLTLLPLFVLN